MSVGGKKKKGKRMEKGDVYVKDGDFAAKLVHVSANRRCMDLAINELFGADMENLSMYRYAHKYYGRATIEETGEFYHRVHPIIRIEGNASLVVTETIKFILIFIKSNLRRLRKGITEAEWELIRLTCEARVQRGGCNETVEELMDQRRKKWDEICKRYHAQREKQKKNKEE